MKPLTLPRRVTLVLVLVLIAAGGAVFGEMDSPQEALPAARPTTLADSTENIPFARLPESSGKPARLALEKLNRVAPQTDDVDLFAAKSWFVAPPPPISAVAPASPPKPVAPALPYSYLGQIEDKDGVMVFLVNEGELISARQGDALDEKHRLETVSADQLTIVYLPLGEKQILPAQAK